jgi:SAM-dependent methyltransferase
MNAEELDFPDGSFEVVCGMGILHHLNLERAAAEIQRVLKPGGRAVFLEPLGHNPVINLFRRLTPKARTQDEHPLLMKDLALLESLLGTPDFHFHHLAELLAIPFAKTPLGAPLRRLTGKLDGRLLGRPSLQPLAWVVVMRFTKPPAA